MESKKRKKVLNLVMLLLIGVIAACGVVVVGNLKGWFEKKETSFLVSGRISGVVNIQRSGIGYSLERDVTLRTEDLLSTQKGAEARLCLKETDAIVLGEKTELKISELEGETLCMLLSGGECFADIPGTGGKVTMELSSCDLKPGDAVFGVQKQTGSASVYVLAGDVQALLSDGTGEHAGAGEILQILETESGEIQLSVSSFSPASLNDFLLAQALKCNSLADICFSERELQQVVDDREAQRKAALEESLRAEAIPMEAESETEAEETLTEEVPTEEALTEAASETETEKADFEDDAPDVGEGYRPEDDGGNEIPVDSDITYSDNTETVSGNSGAAGSSAGNSQGKNSGSQSTGQANGQGSSQSGVSGSEASGGQAQNQSAGQGNAQEQGATGTAAAKTCTISIYCDTILNNLEDLSEGKEAYVPANGCILSPSLVEFADGETVFDVLTRVCSYAGIQLEYSWTPLYNSYYIEGINHLYEFDCGNESGWMYKVNGWFPNYGCSAYELSDKDTIVWCYTCKGLGADVGGGV